MNNMKWDVADCLGCGQKIYYNAMDYSHLYCVDCFKEDGDIESWDQLPAVPNKKEKEEQEELMTREQWLALKVKMIRERQENE